MNSLLTKKDLSLLINLYKKNGYSKLNNMIKKNYLDLQNKSDKKVLQKVINISSDPIDLIKSFYIKYLKLVGGELEDNEKVSEEATEEATGQSMVVEEEKIIDNKKKNVIESAEKKYNYNPTIINNIYKKEDAKSKTIKAESSNQNNNQANNQPNNQQIQMMPYPPNQQYMVPYQSNQQYMVPYQPNQQHMIPYNPNYQNINVPLTYNLPKEEKNEYIEDPQLKNIINNLEKHILKKIKDKNEIDKGLNSNLQQNIKAELKHRIMEEVKSELKDKIASYATQTLASKISKDDDRKNKHDSGSVYQDTVPPFYSPQIVLP